MDRAPGLSVRLKLTLSYAGFLMLAGAVLLAVGYFSLSRGVHPGVIFLVRSHADLWRAFAPTAAIVMIFLLVFGLLGGWLLAGRHARPPDAHHRRHPPGRERVPLPPDRVERPYGRVPRARRRLRHHARAARGTRRRTAEIRVQRLPRTAHPAGDHADTSRRRTQRSEPRQRRARRPPPRRQRPSDRSHRSTAPAQPRRPAVLHPRTRRPVRSSPKKPPKRCSPLAEKRGLTIETSGDPATAIGSHALLLQLSTNLVHNAIVHNLPEQGTVWVTTSVHPKSAVLTVENTGEKLTPTVGCHACRAVSSRHRTHTRRPRR